MRCTQIIGLSKKAIIFLKKNGKIIHGVECKKCHHKTSAQLKSKVYEDAKHYGMYKDGPLLLKYELNDGRIAREVVQASPWSSGPCIFLALEIDGKIQFKWSQEEIDTC